MARRRRRAAATTEQPSLLELPATSGGVGTPATDGLVENTLVDIEPGGRPGDAGADSADSDDTDIDTGSDTAGDEAEVGHVPIKKKRTRKR